MTSALELYDSRVSHIEARGGIVRVHLRKAQHPLTHRGTDRATGVLDNGETPGFAVLDLSGRYALNKQVDVKLGVDNVFDRTYAEHLNRSNYFDPVQVQINEPGRNVWLRLSAAL